MQGGVSRAYVPGAATLFSRPAIILGWQTRRYWLAQLSQIIFALHADPSRAAPAAAPATSSHVEHHAALSRLSKFHSLAAAGGRYTREDGQSALDLPCRSRRTMHPSLLLQPSSATAREPASHGTLCGAYKTALAPSKPSFLYHTLVAPARRQPQPIAGFFSCAYHHLLHISSFTTSSL